MAPRLPQNQAHHERPETDSHDDPRKIHASSRRLNNQAYGFTAWTDQMRQGMGRMATDEAERLKVTRRLF